MIHEIKARKGLRFRLKPHSACVKLDRELTNSPGYVHEIGSVSRDTIWTMSGRIYEDTRFSFKGGDGWTYHTAWIIPIVDTTFLNNFK